MSDLEKQIGRALEIERKAKSRSDTKRSLIVVFGVIPAMVLLAVAGWIAVRIMNGG